MANSRNAQAGRARKPGTETRRKSRNALRGVVSRFAARDLNKAGECKTNQSMEGLDMTDKTCAERVENELRGRIFDLRVLYNEADEEDTAEYLKAEGYEVEDMSEREISEVVDELRYNYGLCFDYVAPETFKDQPEGFFRYQLSTGGPGDEFRFYTNPDFSVHKIEYWFLDWNDGAKKVLTGKDYELLKAVFEDFNEMGVVESEYNIAMED